MRELKYFFFAASVVLHVCVLLLVWFLAGLEIGPRLVAAGAGAGGGSGQSVEIGLVSNSQLFGLSPEASASGLSNSQQVDRKIYEQVNAPSAEGEFAIPGSSPKKFDIQATDRPVKRQSDRIYTADQGEAGGRSGKTVVVGPASGSATPQMLAGVGLGSGEGSSGDGLPGGSEYGRRIQMIFSRNYTPPSGLESGGVQYVVVRLRVSRAGRILSVVSGRLAPSSIIRLSPLPLVNSAAERAIIASDPLPPFPIGVLPNSSGAVLELWFKYPK